MAQDQQAVYYSGKRLMPKYRPDQAQRRPMRFAPNLQLDWGTIVGMATTNAADVQTFTATGTPTGGSFTFLVTNPITNGVASLVIPYNCSSTTLQALVNSIFGNNITDVVAVGGSITSLTGVGTVTATPNVTAGGGPWPATPLTLTGSGLLANGLIPLATAGANAFTGGSTPAASVAHTTVGSLAGVGQAYGTAVAVPAAPAVTASGSSGTFGAGSYPVQVTYVTSLGETTPSPASPLTLTSAQGVSLTAITGIPNGVTKVNVYVNGLLAGPVTVTSNATSTTVVNSWNAADQAPPTQNTSGGNVVGALEIPIATDANGRITPGYTTGGVPPFMETFLDAPVFVYGWFDVGDLKGLDANAVSQLGKIDEGSLAAGNGTIAIY